MSAPGTCGEYCLMTPLYLIGIAAYWIALLVVVRRKSPEET
jgi:hypothetical protein